MFKYNELKKGVMFVMDGQPYEVVDSDFLRMQQRKPVMQTKIKNLITGKVLEKNFQQSDSLEEADIAKESAEFVYCHRGECVFAKDGDQSNRFSLEEEQIEVKLPFLKEGAECEVIYFNGDPIKIELPVKIELKVTQAPPAIKGNTAQGGTKQVTVETGAKVSVPLFIEKGDTIEVNTETGEYTRRV